MGKSKFKCFDKGKKSAKRGLRPRGDLTYMNGWAHDPNWTPPSDTVGRANGTGVSNNTKPAENDADDWERWDCPSCKTANFTLNSAAISARSLTLQPRETAAETSETLRRVEVTGPAESITRIILTRIQASILDTNRRIGRVLSVKQRCLDRSLAVTNATPGVRKTVTNSLNYVCSCCHFFPK